jgi:hypothetical protein
MLISDLAEHLIKMCQKNITTSIYKYKNLLPKILFSVYLYTFSLIVPAGL